MEEVAEPSDETRTRSRKAITQRQSPTSAEYEELVSLAAPEEPITQSSTQRQPRDSPDVLMHKLFKMLVQLGRNRFSLDDLSELENRSGDNQ